MAYLEYQFQVSPLLPGSDILIAELAALGFESFVETESGVLAYIKKDDFNDWDINQLQVVQNPTFDIQWNCKEIPLQNWNATWEDNFTPIRVGDKCLVRAPFHPKEEVEYDLVITPKMSFGTGHHETTHMMLQLLLEEDLHGKTVLDMGCGTGILAILAEQKGAIALDAVDVDPWCFENAKENVLQNNCKQIQVIQGDVQVLEQEKMYDVILANINRNILLADLPAYISRLSTTGSLLLSGFYLNDLDAISSKCIAYGLQLEKKLLQNEWVAAKYVH